MAALYQHAGEAPPPEQLEGPALVFGDHQGDKCEEQVAAGGGEQQNEEQGEGASSDMPKMDKGGSFEVNLGNDKIATGRRELFMHSRAATIGFSAQYFAVGLVYGGIPATTYGVFLGYLNVPAYVYATVSVVSSLPWSFKFFFGLVNDTVPICGLRRKPYMMLGWGLCAATLLLLARTPLPPPYWCADESTGEYITSRTLADGSVDAAEPCNPQAAEQGGKYAILLMLASLGYVIADVAADGLTTEYARAEPIEQRGSTQTTVYLTRTLGQACATLFVGVCMNSKLYNGSFSWGLSFNEVCFCFAVPPAIMVPLSGLLVREPSRESASGQLEAANGSWRRYLAACWELLKSKACFYVVVYCFFNNLVSGISTTAQSQVKQYWAGVENFQNQMFSLFGNLLFAFGLWLVKKRFLQTSWRLMLGLTMVFLQLIDSIFSILTIFDVVRNQYFYLGETVLIEVPSAANFVISTFVIVEMADDGNEGMVYGLLTTTSNLGGPLARAIGNQVYRLFQPSLSDSGNYIRDTPEFRRTVFHSFLLSYAFALASLGFLFFLPDQKEQAQHRKRTWKKRRVYGVITLVMLSAALVYSLVVNFLSMSPSTMCLKFAGGDGCDQTVLEVSDGGTASNTTR